MLWNTEWILPQQSNIEVRHGFPAKLAIHLVNVYGVKAVGIACEGRLSLIYHECTLFEAVFSVDRVMSDSPKPPSDQAIDKALQILLQSFEEENRVDTKYVRANSTVIHC